MKNTTQHKTWEVYYSDKGYTEVDDVTIEDGNGSNLLWVDETGVLKAKNAEVMGLIAAAPELLGACEAALYELTFMGSIDSNRELVELLENAINKAKGNV